jgi:hypothetical protein
MKKIKIKTKKERKTQGCGATWFAVFVITVGCTNKRGSQ